MRSNNLRTSSLQQWKKTIVQKQGTSNNLNACISYKRSRVLLTALLFLLISLSTTLTGHSQQSELESIAQKFDVFRKNTLQEKIYVHTDRSSYLTGETAWFKVYLVEGSLHKLLNLSKVVYLEITDANHIPVLQTKISMESGKGNGSLYLPPTINSGNYFIRAYTSWMKNFPADFFFSKTISIINTFKQLEVPQGKPPSAIDIQFFPEGGNLVTGLKSKVAFRATDSSGNGIPLAGAVLNQHNDTLVIFTPSRFGIGSFPLTPRVNEQYRAVVRQPSGEISHHALPQGLENGYTLSLIDSSENKLFVRVQAKLSNPIDPLPVYLFVHARNVTTTKAYKFISNNSCTFTIDKETLSDGISHITLFDNELNPVCERLYFKQPKNILIISLNPDKKEYQVRRNVVLDLKTQKKNNTGSSSDLSVSVYKLDSLPQHSGNIITSFWLTNDLKGTIESPEYYFSSNSYEVRIATDNLMMTHGWRRFRWADVLDNRVNTPFTPEHRGPIIKGIVLDEGDAPVAGVMTYLSSPGKIIRLYTSLSNNAGEVIFEMQKIKGSSNLILQLNPKKDSTYKIKLDNFYSQMPLSKVGGPFHVSPNHAKSILDRSVAMQVQDIYFEEKLEVESKQATDSSAFYGKPDEVYQLDSYTRFPVMEEVMREYIKGVWVRKRKDGFHFMVLNTENNSVFDDSPLMLVDGVPFFDEDKIMAFDPLKVRQLDVITRRYYLGPASFPGLVSFRTYTGDLAGFPLNPQSIKIDYEGLQQQREFYSPQYDNAAQRKSRMPDQRTLLYWNPIVITNSKGEAQLEFYTSDLPGVFQIVIEGITNDGVFGSSTSSFQVLEK